MRKSPVLVFCFLLSFLSHGQSQLQGDSSNTAPNHLYSFTVDLGAGYATKLGNSQNRYWEDLIAGSELESRDYRLESMGYPKSELETVNVNANLTWRYRIQTKLPLNALDWSIGLGFWSIKETGSQAIIARFPSGLYHDTILTRPMLIGALSLNFSASIHSKPFLRVFGLFTGANLGIAYGRLGQADNIHSWNMHLTYTYGSRHIAGLPIGLKYNASCDLNIEFIYCPSVLFSSQDIFRPKDFARLNQFSIALRYKFLNTPASNPNKRVDIFF